MTAIAHFVAIIAYMGAAALAALPIARRVNAPVRGVAGALGIGVLAHLIAVAAYARQAGAVTLTGLGPSLSFAGLVLAATLLLVEIVAREVSLTVVAAPLAALPTAAANIVGMTPGAELAGVKGVWLLAHITLSFIGFASFATAAAAGTMYLIQRRELRSRHFGSLFRFFPPLATLDRVNHVASIAGWIGLTLGVVLAGAYSITYREMNLLQLMWGTGAWIAVSALALGRVIAGWQARRAALISAVGFAVVLVLYVALRATAPDAGRFL